MNYRVSEGAEKHIQVQYPVMVEGAKVGAVTLIDYMGTDQSIVNAARISYEGQPRKREDEKLLHYLWKHRHTSPFEQVQLTFRIEAPIFVARQWMRHRTQAINEMSLRYTEAKDEMYIPGLTRMQGQDNKNKQASGTFLVDDPEDCANIFWNAKSEAFMDYQRLLDKGLSRELARSVLPVGTMTEWVFSQSLFNLLHWHRLRIDSHAQPEIRVFAEQIGTILQDGWPVTMGAYNKFKSWTIDMDLYNQLTQEEKYTLQRIGVQL